jgi:hypothetical protein
MIPLGWYPNVLTVAALFVAPAIPAFLVRLAVPFPLRRFPWLRRYLIAAVLVAVAGIAFALICFVASGASTRPRSWGESFQSEGDVRREIANELPMGSEARQVLAYARSRGLECSEPTVSEIVCSSPAPPLSALVARKWLVDMQLSDGKLSGVSVTQGLTGP